MKHTSIPDILDLWPTRAALADDLGLAPNVVSNWWQRGHVPGAYWHELVVHAARRGLGGVTLCALARASAVRAGRVSDHGDSVTPCCVTGHGKGADNFPPERRKSA